MKIKVEFERMWFPKIYYLNYTDCIYVCHILSGWRNFKFLYVWNNQCWISQFLQKAQKLMYIIYI